MLHCYFIFSVEKNVRSHLLPQSQSNLKKRHACERENWCYNNKTIDALDEPKPEC